MRDESAAITRSREEIREERRVRRKKKKQRNKERAQANGHAQAEPLLKVLLVGEIPPAELVAAARAARRQTLQSA